MENMRNEADYANYGMDEASVTGKGKKKKKQTRGGDGKIVAALVSIVVAFVIFIVLLTVQKYIINSEETRAVVVASVDVPKGLVLTQENMPNYFKVERRAVSQLPEQTYSSGHSLVGKVTDSAIAANQLVTPNLIVDDNFYEGIVDPVEISLELAKIGQAVGGTLRAGDVVDLKLVVDMSDEDSLLEGVVTDPALSDIPEISIVDGLENTGSITGEDGDVSSYIDPETGEVVQNYIGSLPGVDDFSGMVDGDIMIIDGLTYSVTGKYACATVAENVRVTSVYTSAGLSTQEAEAAGSSQVATVINVVIPRAMQDVICLAQEEGTLRLGRVIDVKEEVVEEETQTQLPVEETAETDVTAETNAQ